jgi:pSer/pThr/pTyr-binding forkhead associated (FHA) protein
VNNFIFCPACHFKNEADAEVCVICGKSLEPIRLSRLAMERDPSLQTRVLETPPEQGGFQTKLPTGTLALFLQNKEEPIIFRNFQELIIGRMPENDSEAFLDLTQYSAYQLGVSRQHARITHIDNKYILEDMGSTNGTWVNSHRLESGETHALSINDVIDLGHFRITVSMPVQDQD